MLTQLEIQNLWKKGDCPLFRFQVVDFIRFYGLDDADQVGNSGEGKSGDTILGIPGTPY
jgi:hypothetical protein